MIEIRPPFPSVAADTLPWIDAARMAQVDQLATDRLGLSLLGMTELAGAHVAELVRAELDGDLRGRRVVVAAGPGNNGAGGLAAARHLANRGAAVRVVLARPAVRLSPAGLHHLGPLLEMAVQCCVAVWDLPEPELLDALDEADVVVDAVLGYGARGAPRDEVGWLVERLGRASTPVVSLDLPSGVDADSGQAPGVAVRAVATLTIGLPKPGLFRGAGLALAGRVFLGDVGLPAHAWHGVGREVDTPFAVSQIVRLEPPAAAA